MKNNDVIEAILNCIDSVDIAKAKSRQSAQEFSTSPDDEPSAELLHRLKAHCCLQRARGILQEALNTLKDSAAPLDCSEK